MPFADTQTPFSAANGRIGANHLFAHWAACRSRTCSTSSQLGDEPCLLKLSLNHFDVRPVTWRPGERRVAGDDRRIERLCQRYIHGIVRRDVLAQFPRAGQEIEVGMTMEIEVGEIRNRVDRSVS
jgi:hypothetical protein